MSQNNQSPSLRSNRSWRKNTQRRNWNDDNQEDSRWTRRGVPANYLLNFSLPERQNSFDTRKYGKKVVATRTQKEFLHANFRFVIANVQSDESHRLLEDLVEWKNVKQVKVWQKIGDSTQCPICLDELRLPRTTRCGHIFCWPCILHYLSLSDKYWRRCPMCFECVEKNHLRAVEIEIVAFPPVVGSTANFKFLQRPKIDILSSYRQIDHCKPSKKRMLATIPSVYDPNSKFSRVMQAPREYFIQLLVKDLQQLRSLADESRSCGEVNELPFIEEAILYTTSRLDSVEVMQDGDEPTQMEDINNAEGKKDVLYSWYQLENGTYVVLHPVNMKCLLKEALLQSEWKNKISERNGDFDVKSSSEMAEYALTSVACGAGNSTQHDALPDAVQGEVLCVEHRVMDDESQRRYRFLSHLPKYCDFYLCELNLSHYLSKKTLQSSKKELATRRRQREAKKKLLDEQLDGDEVIHALPYTSTFTNDLIPSISPRGAEELKVSNLVDEFDELRLQNTRITQTSDDTSSSYATITRNSGYFPALEGSTPQAPASAPAFEQPIVPWGRSREATHEVHGHTPSEIGHKKMKGKRKNCKEVFSTSQRRSYR